VLFQYRGRNRVEKFFLDDIALSVDPGSLSGLLGIRGGMEAEVLDLVDQALKVARPKAMYRITRILDRTEDGVTLEGVLFKSRVLRVNLEQAERVFPYVATCGAELDDWSKTLTDRVHRHWAESIKAVALGQAQAAMVAHLREYIHPGDTAMMNPGSIADWPLSEQPRLFRLLGEGPARIGVVLRDDHFMDPPLSVSGIRFPTKESFESCMLCPREACPGRRAAYDKNLYARKYKK